MLSEPAARLLFQFALPFSRQPVHANPRGGLVKADSTLRSSQAVPHPSTNRALRRLTSEVRRDPVYSTWCGRRRGHKSSSREGRKGRKVLQSSGHARGGPPGKTLGRCRLFSRPPAQYQTTARDSQAKKKRRKKQEQSQSCANRASFPASQRQGWLVISICLCLEAWGARERELARRRGVKKRSGANKK